MAKKEYDLWLERFSREAQIKSAIILSGNTGDLFFNAKKGGTFTGLLDVLYPVLKDIGFTSITTWNRVDGMKVQGENNDFGSVPNQIAGSNAYDLGDDDDIGDNDENTSSPTYKEPREFFPYILSVMHNPGTNRAIILDYSDYLFGNANSFSEAELSYLATLGKVVQEAQKENINSYFSGVGNIIILITRKLASIPPTFYLNNPLVSDIEISLPSRNERERFVDAVQAYLKVKQDIVRDHEARDNFLDALEGLSLRDIAEVVKLSRQMNESDLSIDKLLNLYKYGEKISPWEELSPEKLQGIKAKLQERVKGQDEAISKVKDVVIRAYTGFAGLQHSTTHRKPKGTLFFVGPTGVGKTELAKALAEFVFGDENACIRFDMSEYNHEHSDQRLVGAPPGYVGYEAGGQLTNAVKAKPFCVLLFDEIEKAHGRILDKFLQILEDGRLTDGKGETVSFSESIIIFTSNIGAADIRDTNLKPEEVRKKFREAVSKHFIDELKRPELLNRIGDNIVAFNFIEDFDVFAQIAKLKLQGVAKFVKERYKADLEFEDEKTALTAIAKASDKKNGGRGMLNIIETKIINPLSEFVFINSNRVKGRKIKVKCYQGKGVCFGFDID